MDEQLFDYLEGRMSARRAAETAAHLSQCAHCGSLHDMAIRLREDVIERGARHLASARLIELADGHGEARTAGEERHLAACADCREEAAWLAELREPSLESLVVEPAPPRGRYDERPGWTARARAFFRGHRLALASLAGAAVVSIALVLVVRPGSETRVRRLAVVAPIELEVPRGGGAQGEGAAALQRGLARYRAGEYRDAAEALDAACRALPEDPRAELLLGSSLLLQGRAREALAPLRRAQALAADSRQARGSTRLLDEIRWQLANAALASGDADEARGMLDPIITGEGEHAGRALALRDELAKIPRTDRGDR